MLKVTTQSFVVENSPDYLKENYNVVSYNNNDWFTDAVFKSGILNL